MKAYQIKITEKNTKPPVWWRIIIPAGITFSALSVILDDITGEGGTNSFTFSFYQTLDLFEEDEDNPLQPRGWQYDAQEASSTFIDDYFKEKKRLSYETALLSAGIEVEKKLTKTELSVPFVIKTSFSSNVDDFNERLQEKYELIKGSPAFIKKKEIIKRRSQSRQFPYASKPISAKDNLEKSASHKMEDAAALLRKAVGSYDSVPANRYEKLFAPEKDRRRQPLSQFLEDVSLSALRRTAKELHIPRYSVMEKDELCSTVSAELLKPEVIRRRLISLSSMHLDIFEQVLASEKTVILKGEVPKILFEAIEHIYYAFVSPDDIVTIPFDVADVCRCMDLAEIKETLEKYEWIEFILEDVVPPYYGYIPIDKFCRLCARRRDPEIKPEEVMELYHQLAPQRNPSIVLDGCIADKHLKDAKTYQFIRNAHGNKPYDIVPFAELKDLFDNGYPAQNVYYAQLKRFLLKESDLSEEDVCDLLNVLHEEIAFSGDLDDVFDLFSEEEFAFSAEASMRLGSIVQNVMNNTRTYYNCGYTPSTIHKVMLAGKKPSLLKTIIPISSEAAKLMEQAKPEIDKLGVKVDLDAAAVVPARGKDKKNRKPGKIYPNDPCPCGSGKKYKKCCGR
ncbi:MAG: SEC-C domain-containing protein [Clostridia bacterium]|nr:SEC-C domain-containing protein [Clostridia bacterium]